MPKQQERRIEVFEQVIVFKNCFTCGLPVAMTEAQERYFNESGESWICVLGHQTCRRKGDNAELREKLAFAESLVTSLETKLKDRDAMLNAETKRRQRLTKRVENGVCPHCHRTFQQLARHMKSQHG